MAAQLAAKEGKVFPNKNFTANPTYYPPRLLTGRSLLALWAILSVFWAGAVVYNLCHRVSTQADMSQAVERDLDQGLINASCTGTNCDGKVQAVPPTENWSGIASTYVRFGSGQMIECALGPPAALLIVGLTGLFIYRKRQANSLQWFEYRQDKRFTQ